MKNLLLKVWGSIVFIVLFSFNFALAEERKILGAVPNTGENRKIWIFVIICVVCAVLLVLLYLLGKKSKKSAKEDSKSAEKKLNEDSTAEKADDEEK